MNLNSYNQQVFKSTFVNSEIYKKIISYYGNDVTVSFDPVHLGVFDNLTPRQLLSKKIVTAVSFYYLQFLLDFAPRQMLDIGCGDNTFKNFLPNVIGIDPYPFVDPGPDKIESFDQTFVLRHKEQYECAFSINALHFVSLSELSNRILDFSNLIKPGGRGYISLNAARMVEKTSDEERISLFGSTIVGTDRLAEYCDTIVKDLPLQFLVVDNLINHFRNEYIDGNLRLVFEK